MDQVKTTHGSMDSLSHLSQCSSPRMEALSEDQFSLRSEDSRVKFMCSYGGRIMPRPHDCQLRYVGGETRLLVVSRNISLADLMAKLTRLCGKSVLLKFQLPNEDLDSLVSVLCEEDLENMMEEYDRLDSRDTSIRLRLFLFPAKSHSSSLEFHEFDSRNAEQRFVDAVNGFSRRQNSLPTSQGLPDFLFGLDVFEKQARMPGAHPKANSQPLPCTRSYHEGVLERDQLSLLTSPSILQPMINSQQDAASKQHPTILLDSPIPISNSSIISVADHSLEDLEVIKQLSSLIRTPLELQVSEKKQPLDTVLGSSDEEKNWPRNLHRKPELDLARELNLLSTSDDPHRPTKGGLFTSSAPIDEKQRKNPLSIRVSADLKSPVESPTEEVYVEGNSTHSQHLPKILHNPPVLSDEPDQFHADLHSNAQKTKSVSNPANGDISSLRVLKPEPSTESARKQQHSSDKQGEDGDQKNQKKGQRQSEDHSESLTSHGKACKRYPYLNAEGQQEINDKASTHIQEGYKFEDTEIPLKSKVAQYSNQQQILQPHVVTSNSAHAIRWQEEDQLTQHVDGGAVQLPRTSSFQQQTGPSQFPPSTILRAASASPPSRAYDLPRSAQRHCMAGVPQPAHLHRQVTSAMAYSELQQEPFPLPQIKVGQPNRDQAVPRASKVQSPSRFRDIRPPTPFQVQWLNSEERMLRSTHQPSGGTMIHSVQQDHYVDPNGHLLYDRSTTQLHYAGHLNPSELSQFKTFQDELGPSNDLNR